MLAGEPPFTGPTAQAIVARRLTEPAPSVRAARPTVPPARGRGDPEGAGPVPADRFATVAEFAQALHARTGATTSRWPSTAAPDGRARPSPRRPPRLRAASAPRAARRPDLGLGFLIGVGVLFAWRRGHPGADAERHPGRRRAPLREPGRLGRRLLRRRRQRRGPHQARPGRGLEVIARGSSIEYRRTHQAAGRDRPRAGRRLPAHRHRALGEVGRARAGCGSRPSWWTRGRASRPAPAGASSSTPRSPTSSRCRPTSRPRWPTRSAWPWPTAPGASSRPSRPRTSPPTTSS